MQSAVRRRDWYRRGLKAGIPIGLGYFSVAFAIGIQARNAGMNAFQATLMSFLCNASAGQYAGIAAIAANASYLELAVMEVIANARYLLMSFALSQKLDKKTGLLHRLLMGWYVTDEVFGVTVSVEGTLSPYYTYGTLTPACIGWASGTFLGAVVGSILPDIVLTALSVGLYGMFIAVFIPAAKKDRTVLVMVAASMILSFAFNELTMFNAISSGMKTIILTVVISAAGAVLAPIKNEEGGEDA